MFAPQVRREADDLAQELRVRVWRAVATYDPAKSGNLERYVFSVVTNKVKDYKRDAAREANRRERYGIAFLHIEDTYVSDGGARVTAAERFDQLYNHVTHDQVFAEVEAEPFELPPGVTDRERLVLALLIYGSERDEIAALVSVSREDLDALVRTLRRKFADWRPARATTTQLARRELVDAALAVAA